MTNKKNLDDHFFCTVYLYFRKFLSYTQKSKAMLRAVFPINGQHKNLDDFKTCLEIRFAIQNIYLHSRCCKSIDRTLNMGKDGQHD